MSLLDDIRNVLEGAKGRDDSFTARCPAHDDGASSLSVRLPRDTGDPDGVIELKCFTGCKREAIVDALKAKGVKFEGRKKRDSYPTSTASMTRKLRFDVRDATGRLLAYKERVEEKRGGLWKAAKQEQKWYQPDGTPGLGALKTDTMLYRLEVLKDNPESVVVLTEGERKADDLAKIGVSCALGLVGGANNPPGERVLRNLEGRTVYLWPDNDEPGRKLMARVRDRLTTIAAEVAIIEWPEAPEKGDASDFLALPGNGLEAVEALLDAADARGNPRPPWERTIADGLKLALADFDRRARRETLDVARTGIDELDKYLGGGMRRGEVYLLGAPTGGGKTTLLQSFALNVATGDPDRGIPGKRVLLITPEMSLVEIGRRAIAREAGGLDDMWGKPDLVEGYTRIASRLFELPIVMADKPDITIAEVFAQAKRLAREPAGLGLVLVDYAQHVVSEEDGRRPRYLAVGDVMTGCIDMAKKLNVPVMLASQVNYIAAEKGGKPEYTFRESAKLEHGSTVTLIFDLVERYNPDDATPEDQVEVKAKILCKKNRLGILFGKILVTWNKPAFLVTQDAPAVSDLVTADTPAPPLPGPPQARLPYNEPVSDSYDER